MILVHWCFASWCFNFNECILLSLFKEVNFIQVQSYPLLFTSGQRQNDTACFNITVIDNNITENTNFFTVYICGNDTGLHLAPPTNATVGISDSDCE